MTLPNRLTVTRALAGCLTLVATWAGSGARAEDLVLPEGFPVGPLFVAPSLAAGMFVDSNPFYRSAVNTLPGQSVDFGDVITRFNPAVVATLPFRNSWFRVGYDGVFRRYRDPQTAPNNTQDVAAELSLLFSTYDRWAIRADRSWGAAIVGLYGSGSRYYGAPYTLVTYETSVERNVPGKRGYAASIRWSRLGFDRTSVAFLEYDGFEGALELREPLNPHMWFVAGGAFRRYDYQLASDHSPYSEERTDALVAGVQGITTHGQSWRAVLRYDRARYPLPNTGSSPNTGSDYSGLGGEVFVFLAPGPTSTVTLYATRRSWTSFFPPSNFYVANVLGCRAEKHWRTTTSIGVEAYVDWSVYPDANDVDPDPVTQVLVTRHDRLLWSQLYANFAIDRYYAFRLTYLHQNRTSNVEGVDYRGDAFGVEFVLGLR